MNYYYEIKTKLIDNGIYEKVKKYSEKLKVLELKKKQIRQIQMYMNYIDKNIKTVDEYKNIGIIICKKDNKFMMEYCSDSRIYRTTYKI